MAYLLSDGNSSVVTYPYTIGMLRRDNPNVSFPSSPSEAVLGDWNVYTVATVAQPTIDPYTQTVSEGAPTTSDGGSTWTQTWVVTNLDATAQAEKLVTFEADARTEAEDLLDAADQYVVTALVQGKALTAEFEAYRAALVDYTNLTGYPAATEFPLLPENIFDEASTEVYVAPGIEDHLAKFHSLDTAASTSPVQVYRGYNAFVNQFSISEPSTTQLVIYKESGSEGAYGSDIEPADDDYDTFRVNGVSASDKIALVNIYATDTAAIPAAEVSSFFEAFVDNVMFSGGNTEISTATEYKTNFYNSHAALEASLTTASLIENFEFWEYTNPPSYSVPSSSFTNVTGTLTLTNINITADNNGDYAISGWNQSGLSSDGASAIIPGNLVGGSTPENDVTVTYSYAVNDYVLSGVCAIPAPSPYWPEDYISDGGNDQYDGGNYIITDVSIASEGAGSIPSEYVPYANGEVVTSGDFYFGAGSEYVTTYQDSIFSMFVNGGSVQSIGYDGETGYDNDGLKENYKLFKNPDFEKVATKVATTAWTIEEVAGQLVFSYNGVKKVAFLPDGTIQLDGGTDTYAF